jgi:hypothetical protein
MNTKSTGYGEDTGWKVVNRLSTLNFGPHKTSLNTDPGNSDVAVSMKYSTEKEGACKVFSLELYLIFYCGHEILCSQYL